MPSSQLHVASIPPPSNLETSAKRFVRRYDAARAVGVAETVIAEIEKRGAKSRRPLQLGIVGAAGYFASIRRRMASACEIASAIQASRAGHGRSICASFRAARIVAQIQSTRFRPSLTPEAYHIFFAFYSPMSYRFGGEIHRAEGREKETHPLQKSQRARHPQSLFGALKRGRVLAGHAGMESAYARRNLSLQGAKDEVSARPNAKGCPTRLRILNAGNCVPDSQLAALGVLVVFGRFDRHQTLIVLGAVVVIQTLAFAVG